MESSLIRSIAEGAKNLVFIGEAGSGKTEVSLNLARGLAQAGKKVLFFDMDQTKPLFRARDIAEKLAAEGIELRCGEAFADAPTMAPGLTEALLDEEVCAILDIGGGAFGSHMIGQFSHILNAGNSRVFYIFNAYRPWSGRVEDIEETLRRTMGAARLRLEPELVANPNLGPGTGMREALDGLSKTRALFPNTEIAFVCALEGIANSLERLCGKPVLPVSLNTLPEWMDGSGAE